MPTESVLEAADLKFAEVAQGGASPVSVARALGACEMEFETCVPPQAAAAASKSAILRMPSPSRVGRYRSPRPRLSTALRRMPLLQFFDGAGPVVVQQAGEGSVGEQFPPRL